jgi:type I restriction enzyme, S subunit
MNWPLARLGECCDVKSGATPKTDIEKYWGGEIRWATPKDISRLDDPYLVDTPDKITAEGYRSCSTQLLPVGTVLVSSRAPIGLVAIAGVEMCTNQGFKSLVPGPAVHSNYLYHCMKANSARLAALGNGATFKEVSKSIVEDFEIPLPPIQEQQRIATILDKADSLRRKRQEAVHLADELMRSAFYEIFGDPVANSKNWPEREIAEMGKVTTGNTPSRAVAAYFGEAIEWVKSDNINTPRHWLTRAREGLSELGLTVARTASSGSTLMTCIAGSPSCIGNVAMTDRTVAFNQQINAVTPKAGIAPEFVYALLLFSKGRIQAASTNSMKGMVSKGALEKVRLIWPPADRQEMFVKLFKQVQKLRTRMEGADASALFVALQNRLLA